MIGSVQLSQIDAQVYILLGALTIQQLSEVVEAQARDHVITAHLADLNISHQNHRAKSYRFNVNPGQIDYPMPQDFANAIYAQFTNAPGGILWRPLDLVITNFTALSEKQRANYPAIAFIEGSIENPGIVGRLSWYPDMSILAPLQVEVWYTDSALPARTDQAVMPLQDIFLPKVVNNIALAVIDEADMPDEKRERKRSWLLMDAAKWDMRWDKLINRAPSQGPYRKQRFNQSRSLLPSGSGGWWR